MENFDLSKIRNLSFNDSKTYLSKYIVPLSNGNYAFLEDGNYNILNYEVVKRVYVNKLPKDLSRWFLNEYDKVYKPVYQLTKPTFYDNNINLTKPLPIKKPFDSFDDKTKKATKLFISYIEEVLCCNDKDKLKYTLQWLGNMFRGNKNDSCIVFKTHAEGVGKSTLPQFIIKHVLKALSLEIGSQPLKSNFNSILGGKLFVNFEELECTAGEWMMVLNNLKRYITSCLITLEAKGADRYEAENINNYMLISNFDIPDYGRRFYTSDISTSREGDIKYWSNIYSTCFNDLVGYAFYNYCIEVDLSDYKAQTFPETKAKLDSISKRLDSVYLFLKEEFILKKQGINHVVNDLYMEYCSYIIGNSNTSFHKKPLGKTEFNSRLSEVQIKYFDTTVDKKRKNKYVVSAEDLLTLAKKKKWLNDLDEFVENDDETTLINNNPHIDGKTKREIELEKQIEELKRQIQNLENTSKINDYKEVVTDTENEMILSVSSDIIIPVKLQNIETLDDIIELDNRLKIKNKAEKKAKESKRKKKQVSYNDDEQDLEQELEDLLNLL